ncbi:DNA-binding response regulator [Geothermobacter hydrogeniphilus]|uniref:DNA-binding response regulator n=1 Tax=Geothermobacter hydrogeniphilus TaxID=1969733 RepID=A0A2K2HDE5_9BACT|nr:sigma-54 dependent transcriptional regulator [Geothermobacter hydrogeniphilus]PNU21310.1 DNA-binding response regulator [Geothermobacter hydrogeniphilus]
MPERGGTILVVDDDTGLRRVIQHNLEEAGYNVMLAEDGETGFRLFQQTHPRLVLTDVRMGGLGGLELLTRIKAYSPDALVVVVTAFGSLEEAVKAIRLGAYDYLGKPFSREQLVLAVSKALAFQGLTRENRKLKAALSSRKHRVLLGDSPQMQAVHNLIRRMATAEAPVLILGEGGTGKELVALQLHRQGARRQGPFVAVNCAAIPEKLLESELFGHLRGAFPGAARNHRGKFDQADGGTLFLDEVGELPAELQSKLLHALRENEITPIGGKAHRINVRVISATNRNLETEISCGRFCRNLYSRLAVLPLSLPPLRDREEDIPLLAQHFLDRYSGDRNLSLSREALNALQCYPWPGNVRELENLMERLAILARADLVERDELPLKILTCGMSGTRRVVHLPPEGYSLEEIEKQAILQALALCSWNRTRAAEFLRISSPLLTSRIEKYDLVPEQREAAGISLESS